MDAAKPSHSRDVDFAVARRRFNGQTDVMLPFSAKNCPGVAKYISTCQND